MENFEPYSASSNSHHSHKYCELNRLKFHNIFKENKKEGVRGDWKWRKENEERYRKKEELKESIGRRKKISCKKRKGNERGGRIVRRKRKKIKNYKTSWRRE